MTRTLSACLFLLLAVPAALAQQAVPASDCADCPALALVPPGSYSMGTPPTADEVDATTGETPPVVIAMGKPFYIGAKEVTVGEFRRFVEATGYEAPLGCRVWLDGQWVEERDRSWRDPGFAQPQADDEPVVCVNWVDARAYADWVSQQAGKRYRLPSEAEWEYVARGGTAFPRYWGAQDSKEGAAVSLACDNANVYDSSAVDAHRLPWPNANCSDGAVGVAPTGRYKPNAFGAYDVIGNVREWVFDRFSLYTPARKIDPSGPTEGEKQRINRGGAWDDAAPYPAARRHWDLARSRDERLGFRVARSRD